MLAIRDACAQLGTERLVGCDLHVTLEPCPMCAAAIRSEEHTSELQSLMRISYAVFCLKKKKNTNKINTRKHSISIERKFNNGTINSPISDSNHTPNTH